MHLIFYRFLMKALQKNATVAGWVLYFFGKLPVVVSMVSILISYHTCGTVGLIISAFFYYFMVKKIVLLLDIDFFSLNQF